jgi:hypothetical protein
MMMQEQQGANILESIPEQIFFGYSLGGYSIGSAGRAPDEITDYKSYEAGVEVHCRIPCQKRNYRHQLFVWSLPSGGFFY